MFSAVVPFLSVLNSTCEPAPPLISILSPREYVFSIFTLFQTLACIRVGRRLRANLHLANLAYLDHNQYRMASTFPTKSTYFMIEPDRALKSVVEL
jgi:hypothetical protein